jgi:hypothetical protein
VHEASYGSNRVSSDVNHVGVGVGVDVGVDEQRASFAPLRAPSVRTLAAVSVNVDSATPAIVLPARARVHAVTPVASSLNFGVRSEYRHVESSSHCSSSSSSALPTSLFFASFIITRDGADRTGRTMMLTSSVDHVMTQNDSDSCTSSLNGSKDEHICNPSCEHDRSV